MNVPQNGSNSHPSSSISMPQIKFERDVSVLMPGLDNLVNSLSNDLYFAFDGDKNHRKLMPVKDLFVKNNGQISLEAVSKAARMNIDQLAQYFDDHTYFHEKTGFKFRQVVGLINFYNSFRGVMSHPSFNYYRQLSKFMSYIQADGSRPISLEEAASIAGMESTYFSAFFHSKVGIKFRDFWRQYRIAKAMDMVTTEDKSVTELTFAVGYSDMRSFERAFKSEVGMTPLEFKKLYVGYIIHRNDPLMPLRNVANSRNYHQATATP